MSYYKDYTIIQKGKLKMAAKLTQQQAITTLNQTHSNYYIYTDSIYTKANEVFEYICPKHGLISHQLYRKHKTNGCPKCGNYRSGHKLSLEQIVVKAQLIHTNYDYSHSCLTHDNRTYLTYVCPIHGNQKQRLDAHLSGNGCKFCNQTGISGNFYKNKNTMLYYVKKDNLFKIGITIHGVDKRFKKIDNVEVIKTWFFEDGIIAYNIEQSILKNNESVRYKGKKILKSGGNTELLIKDILPLIELEVSLH